MNPAPGSRPTIAIGIVTFRRPTLLGGLLDELAGRLPPAGADAFVVVVDNDPEGSAEAVAGARRAAFPVPLRYRREVLPGVSFARNAALAEADLADLVAFIDDDMRPAPGWLEALVAAQRATGAAAVTGPVEPAFERPPPGWLREVFELCYTREAPDGALSSATAGNLLLDRPALARAGVRFAADFSRMGGEDTQLVADLAGAGLRTVWAPEARVIEHIPVARMSAAWLARRWFRYGVIDARVDLRCRPGAGGRVLALRRGAVRIGAGALLLVPALLAALGGRAAAPMRRVYTLARGCGMVAGALGLVPRAYGG